MANILTQSDVEDWTPILSISKQRKRVRLVVAAVLLFAAGVLQIYLALTRRLDATHRGLYVLLGIISFLFCLLYCYLVLSRERPFLTVSQSGIKLSWNKIPWTKIDACSWGQIDTNVLRIHGRHKAVYVPIPDVNRSEVETALARFGKWNA